MKPRACLSCYQRKIKCDRKQPCINCVDSNELCNFPQGKIRRNRPGRRVVDAHSIEKKVAPSKRKLDDAENSLPSQTTTECGEYMIVDSTHQSRLLASNAWANVKEEAEIFKDTLLDTPSRAVLMEPEQLLFSTNKDCNLDLWIPNSTQLETYWRIYQANIDPLIRVLHKPSVRKIINKAQQEGLTAIDTASLTIVLAVCFSAVVSLDSVQCALQFGEDGRSLVDRCKSSVQNAFAQARLLESHNIQVLQAFVVFIACMPPDGTRAAWTLIGLATRIATSLGLHRDGKHFPCLSPFEAEIRRRLWWQIRVLDVRASEDVGTAITGLINSDTAFPENLNDSDWDTASNIHPKARVGVTEMTYSLLCFDSFKIFEKLNPSAKATVEEKERIIDDFSIHLERSYLKDFEANQSSAIFRLGVKTVQILISKMRIQVYFSSLRCEEPLYNTTLPSSKPLEYIFSSAVSILEHQTQLVSEESLKGFRWLLGSYRQMHAMAFVLSQLNVRIDALKRLATDDCLPTLLPDPLERAWSAVQAVFTEYNSLEGPRPSWGPLISLKRKVELKLGARNDTMIQNFEYDAIWTGWTGWNPQTMADLDFFHNISAWQGVDFNDGLE